MERTWYMEYLQGLWFMQKKNTSAKEVKQVFLNKKKTLKRNL